MKQKKGLGSIPKGLQWIGSDINNDVENDVETPITQNLSVQNQNVMPQQSPMQQQQPIQQQPLQSQPQMPQRQNDLKVSTMKQPEVVVQAQSLYQQTNVQHLQNHEFVTQMPKMQPAQSHQMQQNNWMPVGDLSAHDSVVEQSMMHTSDQRGSSQKGLQDGWTRATFILKQDYIEKLKAVSYWERMTIKEVIDEALTLYLQNKDIQDIPKRRSRI